MKPCQFMLALSLFCGGIHNTSTNGSCGFVPVLIEQEDGDKVFSEPRVHKQTEVVSQGMACSPGLSFPVAPPSRETGRAGWESGSLQKDPRSLKYCWVIFAQQMSRFRFNDRGLHVFLTLGLDQPFVQFVAFSSNRGIMTFTANCWLSPDKSLPHLFLFTCILALSLSQISH